MNEMNNEKGAENTFFWQSIKKAAKRSFILMLILAIIDAWYEARYGYQISRVIIYAIMFIIALISAILYVREKK